MAHTTHFTVRMNGEIKNLYGETGINLSTAINVFFRYSLCIGGFPPLFK